MNPYDNANELAKSIKESHEYKKMLEAKKALDTDKDAAKMVKDFLIKQSEMQLEAMSGKEINKEKQEQIQKLYSLLVLNSNSQEYIQCYMRFQLMMEDIYKIMGEVVKPIMDD